MYVYMYDVDWEVARSFLYEPESQIIDQEDLDTKNVEKEGRLAFLKVTTLIALYTQPLN